MQFPRATTTGRALEHRDLIAGQVARTAAKRVVPNQTRGQLDLDVRARLPRRELIAVGAKGQSADAFGELIPINDRQRHLAWPRRQAGLTNPKCHA